MKLKLTLILLCTSFMTLQLLAQDDLKAIDTETKTVTPPKNFLKVNLLGLPLNNFSLQYERVLNKSISFAVTFRGTPTSGLPLKNEILDIVGDSDPEIEKAINNFRYNSIGVTPEVRFYLSKKGYGRGFYIAPFYRYARLKTSQFDFQFQGQVGPVRTINLTGDFTSHTGGILFGAQWAIGKMIVLDWSFFGPHYGGATGMFAGTTNTPMTVDEQNDLRMTLEEVEIPFSDKTVNVNANGATVKLEGPWGGVRAALAIGIRF